MTINSLPFLIFFVIVFVLYFIKLKKGTNLWQNIILLSASYFFYGYTDLRTLPLFAIVTVVFYFLGIFIQKYSDTKKADLLLTLGVVFGVGLLVYFKYLNFLIGSVIDLLNTFGFNANPFSLKLIMPLGISYFVFKLISYIIEIHREEIPATRDFISFATYVAFFPCMLSGPIDRPGSFLPQLTKERPFSASLAVDGMRQILWGCFKKMAIADTLAIYVENHLSLDALPGTSGSTMVFVIIAYTFQIYADFSGYSDMAIGVSKILGLQIARNFKYPLFALNVADFWRRWHMSLTSWMTDYIYVPLSFYLRSLKKLGLVIAIFVNFIIVGAWHGAGLSYIIYGCYYGLMYIPLVYLGAMMSSREPKTNKLGLPVISDFGRMILTFVIVAFGMILFRSTDLNIFTKLISCFGTGLFSYPDFGSKTAWLLIVLLLITEWIQRHREYALDLSAIRSRSIRWSIYFILIFIIFCLGGGEQHFIYQVF